MVTPASRVAGHSVIRIVSVPLGYNPQVVAEWPDTGAFASYAITAGFDGMITVTGSSSRRHAFARFARGPRRLTLRGLFLGDGEISAPAYANQANITYVRHNDDGTYVVEQLALGSHESWGQHHPHETREEGDALALSLAGCMF